MTGLGAEAALVARACRRDPEAPVIVRCGGVGPQAARAAARDMVDAGATALASFGLAGGLEPDYWPGLAVVASEVVTAQGRTYAPDRAWHSRLLAATIGQDWVFDGRLCGSDTPVTNPAAKATLLEKTGALAVDMESHAVAAVAAEAGVPFAAVRAIADPARRGVPAAALAGLEPDGGVAPFAVLRSLATAPWQLPGVVVAAIDGRRGLSALRRVIALAGPALGGPGVVAEV